MENNEVKDEVKEKKGLKSELEELKVLAVPLLMGLLPFLGSGLMIYFIQTYPELVSSSNTATLVGLMVLLMLGLALGLLHASMASIAMGFYFGWNGLLIFSIPYAGACILAYYLCTFLDNGKFNSYLSLMYNKWELHAKDANKNPFVYVFFLRLTPVFPFAITNYLLASLKINFWKMLFGSVAGQLPRSALFVWVGTLITNWIEWNADDSYMWNKLPGDTRYYWAGLIVFGISVLFVMWKRAEKLSKREE